MDPSLVYRKYRNCVIGLETAGQDERIGIGTAFHIGDGYLLTARHVVEQRQVTGVVTTGAGSLSTIHSVTFPGNDDVDLALLSTDFDLSHYMSDLVQIHGGDWPKADAIELGTHLDDWIDDGLVLSSVVMLGFPPIPTARDALMVAASGEVNAVLDRYSTPHVHFVISSPARGGFSGGPVLTRDGWLLGVTTQSLHRESELGEPGFAVALSVEPVFDLLAQTGVAPRANRPPCFLLRHAYPDWDFGSLLSEEEISSFIYWESNLADDHYPRSLGMPSPPLVQRPPVWSA